MAKTFEITLFEVHSDKENAPAYSGILKTPKGELKVVAFPWVSDKEDKRGNKYRGLRVVGARPREAVTEQTREAA